jgi:hypothetical protein
MKKPVKPFTGDCIRQSQLNRSVDDLLKKQRGPWDSEHRRLHDQIVSKKKSATLAGEIICGMLLFVTAVACAVGTLAL